MNVSVAEATKIITYVRSQPLGPFIGSTPAFMDPPSIDPPPDPEYPGFMVDNDTVWGRPAGVAVARDGALLVSDDANGTIFRVTRK